jgi:hypothetical protein
MYAVEVCARVRQLVFIDELSRREVALFAAPVSPTFLSAWARSRETL